jgi:hypothetical protein
MMTSQQQSLHHRAAEIASGPDEKSIADGCARDVNAETPMMR